MVRHRRIRTQHRKSRRTLKRDHWLWSMAKKVGKFAWDRRKYIPSWPGWLAKNPSISSGSNYSYQGRMGRMPLRKESTTISQTAQLHPPQKKPSVSVELLAALRQTREQQIQSPLIIPQSESHFAESHPPLQQSLVTNRLSRLFSGATKSQQL